MSLRSKIAGGDGAYLRQDVIELGAGYWSTAPSQNLETGEKVVLLIFRPEDNGPESLLNFPIDAARFVAEELMRVVEEFKDE